jgi:exonuclease I
MESDFLQSLANKSANSELLFQRVETNFELLPDVLKGVFSSKAAVRYGCSKVLTELSSKYPEKIYPYFDVFAKLLTNNYRILVWNATTVIANLCSVDVDKKFDKIFNEYFALLNNDYMVTVANIVVNSGIIASSKQYLIPRITSVLLKVEDISTTPHLTKECKLVIAEKALESFTQFFDKMNNDDQERVVSFAKRQSRSSRKALREKAELFLKQNVSLS